MRLHKCIKRIIRINTFTFDDIKGMVKSLKQDLRKEMRKADCLQN